jgi:PHP family Zn ribbon phosphoesterase
MLNYFGSEINIMEEAAQSDLARIAGEQIADMIVKMRTGRLPIIPGGGGHYGKVQKNSG